MSGTNYEGLSVCIITKNQRDKLIKCLKAIRAAVPRADIAVLDTGSSDGSVEAAREYTENIGSFNWCDDFSKAKNAAIGLAKNDLVLIIDSDEYLEQGSGAAELIKAHEKYPAAVGRIRRSNTYVNQKGYRVRYDEWINRLFDRRLFHYEGRIHEQVVKKDAADEGEKYDYRTYRTVLSAFHDGYDLSEEELKKKAERNIELLNKELTEHPSDAYLYYQLGKTFYTAGEKEKAAEKLLRALELEDKSGMEYMSDLICLSGYSLLDTGRAEEGLELLKDYRNDERYARDADFLFLYGLLLMNNTLFQEARETFLSCVSLAPSATEGTASYLAWYNAGVISEVLGEKDKAEEYYGRAGSFEAAVQGIKRLKGA